MKSGPVLGIDLGTTNSAVAIADGTVVRVLTDADGNRLLPSVVSFHQSGKILVGYEARERRLVDAENTVYAVKRLIGRPHDSPEVTRARERFAFRIVPSAHGGSVVEVRKGKYALAEISAIVLRELRRVAEQALGQPAERAVITVPASFNELQRSATKAAGKVAGLNVLRILNEPTAAALAYGIGKDGAKRIAVYDLGGGTFDVTVLELEADVFEVVATAGDTFLGGEDLDLAVGEVMAEAFRNLHGIDPRADRQAFERLRAAGEWAKCQLSDEEHVELTIEELLANKQGRRFDLQFELTRRELEIICEPLVRRSFEVCERALATAGMRPSELDAVVLVGGSTRMPLVRRLVEQFFGRPPRTDLDPDLVVCQGAAIHGFALGGGPTDVAIVPRPPRPRPIESEPAPRQPAFAPMVRVANQVAIGKTRETIDGDLDALEPGATPARESVEDDLDALAPAAAGRMLRATIDGDLDMLAPDRPRRPTIDADLDRLAAPFDLPPSRGTMEADLDRLSIEGSPTRGTMEADLDALAPPDAPPPHDLEDLAPPSFGSAHDPLALGPDDPFDGQARPLARDPFAAPQPGAARGPRGPTSPLDPPFGLAGAPIRKAPPPPPLDALPARKTVREPTGSFGTEGPKREATLQFGTEGAPVARPAGRMGEPPPPPTKAPQQRSAAVPPAPARTAELALGLHLWESVPPPEPLPMPASAPLLMDVTPLSLGIETAGGYCRKLIPRNAPVPAERRRVFTTARDDQRDVAVRICQGESDSFEANQVLGEVVLGDLSKGARGDVEIEVAFQLDADGTLAVHATDVASGRAQAIRIDLRGGLGDEDIEAMRARQQRELE